MTQKGGWHIAYQADGRTRVVAAPGLAPSRPQADWPSETEVSVRLALLLDPGGARIIGPEGEEAGYLADVYFAYRALRSQSVWDPASPAGFFSRFGDTFTERMKLMFPAGRAESLKEDNADGEDG